MAASAVESPRPEARRRRSAVTRALPSALCGAAAVAILVWLAWRTGGYFPAEHLLAGGIAFAVAGVLLVLRRPHYLVASEALLALGALAAFAGWIGLSRVWSENPITAMEDFDRALAYVGIFGLGLLAAGSGRLARILLWALFAAIVAVAVGALVSRLHPDLIATSPTGLNPDPYRLSYPLGYWNALGAWAAMGLVLAVALAADRSAWAGLRALAAGAAVPVGAALYLSLSRGAWAALAAGALVLVLFAPRRRPLVTSAAITGGAIALAIVLLAGEPALVDDPALGDGQQAAGDRVTPLLALLALAAAVVQGAVAAARVPRDLAPAWRSLRRLARAAAPWAAGAVVLVAIGAYLVKADAIDRRASAAVVDARDFVDRQWDEFMAAGAGPGSGRERLSSVRGTRSDLYGVALDGFAASPFIGEGAGSFEYRWIRDREVTEKVRDAHSLYLETLSELGLVGLAALALFLATVAAAALRARLRPRALSRAQAAGATAAFAVWAVHAGVDWDWQMPALTGMALVLAATLFPLGRRSRA
jgi:hypothetical protein